MNGKECMAMNMVYSNCHFELECYTKKIIAYRATERSPALTGTCCRCYGDLYLSDGVGGRVWAS